MRQRRIWFGRLALILLGLAAWQLGQGVYIHAKAQLAQYLIANSWAQRLASGRAPAPWPWADSVPVALLEVPRLAVRSWVLADASGRSLAFGPGQVGAGALPGMGGVSLIAGHRDTHFAFLRALRHGDTVRMQTAAGAWRQYQVTATAVIDTALDEQLVLGEGEALLLLTCYPFDSLVPGGSQRYVIRAEPLETPSRSHGFAAQQTLNL